MRIMPLGLLASLVVMMALTRNACLAAQDASAIAADGETSRVIVGHPFSAIKFARRVKVLADGKQQFLRNERYPSRIARDADGQLMMQETYSADNLPRECDRLDLLVPPPCPAWSVFVVDLVAHTITHWGEGEIADHTAIDFPLAPARLEEAADSTSLMPVLGPDFTDEDGKMSTLDLGSRGIEGIQAHGERWTLRYEANQGGQIAQCTRIHEVWTSAEMQLIVRVIDGDPNGEETVWGLERISLAPDAALFRPPEGYEMEHRMSARWSPMIDHFISGNFESLHQWFAQ